MRPMSLGPASTAPRSTDSSSNSHQRAFGMPRKRTPVGIVSVRGSALNPVAPAGGLAGLGQGRVAVLGPRLGGFEDVIGIPRIDSRRKRHGRAAAQRRPEVAVELLSVGHPSRRHVQQPRTVGLGRAQVGARGRDLVGVAEGGGAAHHAGVAQRANEGAPGIHAQSRRPAGLRAQGVRHHRVERQRCGIVSHARRLPGASEAGDRRRFGVQVRSDRTARVLAQQLSELPLAP